MTTNFEFKNICCDLINTDQILFDNQNETQTIVLSGYVSNISNLNQPALAGENDYFNLKIINSITSEETYIYSNILIRPNTTLPLNKIFLNSYTKLVAKSVYNNLQLTISILKQVPYNKGFVKVIFKPYELSFSNPTWNIIGDNINKYNHNQYVSLDQNEYNIEFADIDGWEKPESINIYVKQLKTCEIEAIYTILNGLITFKVNNINLIDDFKWRVVGGEIWYNHNEFISLEEGLYTFEFGSIDGYETPQSITKQINQKTIYDDGITYKRIHGNIQINLIPSYIKLHKTYFIYNRWRLIYENGSISEWFKSGDLISFNAGNYTLEIEDNGYFIPEQNFIDVIIGENTTYYLDVNMTRI